MNLGSCQSCGTRSEMHEDHDGKLVCENCVLGRKPATTERRPEPRQAQQRSGNERETLIDYIVKTASEEWVHRFIETEIDRYRDELTRELRWVPLLEKQENTRVLLRMASLIGYTEKQQPQIVVEKELPAIQKKKAGRPKKIIQLGKGDVKN